MTLHKILWKDNTWEKVELNQLLEAKDVKKYHRKAIMICHPDKLVMNEN